MGTFFVSIIPLKVIHQTPFVLHSISGLSFSAQVIGRCYLAQTQLENMQVYTHIKVQGSPYIDILIQNVVGNQMVLKSADKHGLSRDLQLTPKWYLIKMFLPRIVYFEESLRVISTDTVKAQTLDDIVCWVPDNTHKTMHILYWRQSSTGSRLEMLDQKKQLFIDILCKQWVWPIRLHSSR